MADTTLTFDGLSVGFRPGQSLAAALTEAGHRAFRQTAGDARRGMFCGMGVCQDCLVTIDGVPNLRACMTQASAGLTVETQSAFARLEASAAVKPAPEARVITPDILVIGGGAGGLSAAITARRAGVTVTVLDERKVAGGQYFKQSANAAPMDRQQKDGADLVADARASGAELLEGVEIWGAFDGPLFLAEQSGRALVVRPRATIVATGAYERPVMVPGWTLPGVMTTGAAQTLWRSYRTLPGKRVAVCGSGPLNLQVALELARGGAEIALVAETAPAPITRPFRAGRLVLADPALAFKGINMVRALRGLGVPLLNQTQLLRVDPEIGQLRAIFRGADGKETAMEVDALCMNAGFEPQNEILRLLGAGMTYDRQFGHLRCDRSDTFETDVAGLYAVGDCAGLGGAPAAMAEGRIAGRAAAARLGHGDNYDQFADRRALRRARSFQAALWRLHDPAPAPLQDVPPETIVCRCEELSLADIRQGLDTRPGHVGTLKRATRVGMGRCQGRYCGPVATRMVSEATGKPMEDLSHFAPRVPIKPVSIAAILAAQQALDDPEG